MRCATLTESPMSCYYKDPDFAQTSPSREGGRRSSTGLRTASGGAGAGGPSAPRAISTAGTESGRLGPGRPGSRPRRGEGEPSKTRGAPGSPSRSANRPPSTAVGSRRRAPDEVRAAGLRAGRLLLGRSRFAGAHRSLFKAPFCDALPHSLERVVSKASTTKLPSNFTKTL